MSPWRQWRGGGVESEPHALQGAQFLPDDLDLAVGGSSFLVDLAQRLDHVAELADRGAQGIPQNIDLIEYRTN